MVNVPLNPGIELATTDPSLQTFIQMRAEDEPERIVDLVERGYFSANWVLKKVCGAHEEAFS